MSRWAHLKHNLAQGAGAGLVAGAAVGVVEVLVLVVMDMTGQHVAGLLYAVVVYGALGLLGGLALGLLRGLWDVARGDNRPAWTMFAALSFALGLFLVVRTRTHHDILHTAGQPWSLETLLLDGTLFVVVGLGGAVALRRLLRWLLQGGRTHVALHIAQPRWNLTTYMVVLVAAALLSTAPALAASLANRGLATASIPPNLRETPNVLFIVADTLRADHLSCYGYTGNRTPHIDALARDGMLYRNMRVQSSWTRPSVATMLTSLYPSSHRVLTEQDLLPDAAITLPEVLRERGYCTAGFTTNVHVAPRFNFQQGYDECMYLEPTLPFFASPTASRFAVFTVIYRLRSIFQPPTVWPHDEFYQDAVTLNQHALPWLEANRGSRFFLYLHYMDPHQPYYVHPYDGQAVGWLSELQPDRADAPIIRQLYDGEITFLDTHLGALFDQLKVWGLYDDALIVFTSDHGEEFLEHGGWGHGATLYEEQLAVPLIVKYPGNAHAGTIDEGFARGLDLAPTVLDVIGFPVPEVMQGVSVQPGSATPRAGGVLAELVTIRSIRNRRYKLITANEDKPRGLPPLALFDLQADPREQRNLAQEDLGTVRLLRMELDRVMVFAETHAVAGQSRELDADTRERLRQLGY